MIKLTKTDMITAHIKISAIKELCKVIFCVKHQEECVPLLLPPHTQGRKRCTDTLPVRVEGLRVGSHSRTPTVIKTLVHCALRAKIETLICVGKHAGNLCCTAGFNQAHGKIFFKLLLTVLESVYKKKPI